MTLSGIEPETFQFVRSASSNGATACPLPPPFFQVQYVIYYILKYKKECIIST
jgi:hypothetical protein